MGSIQSQVALKLYINNDDPPLEHYLKPNEVQRESDVHPTLSDVDFGWVSEIQITYYPNHGYHNSWNFCDEVRAIQNGQAFKRGTSIPIIGRPEHPKLYGLAVVHGSDELFEEARRCLDTLSRYLGSKLIRDGEGRANLSLTLDFIAYTPHDAIAVFESLRHIGLVRQMQIKFEANDLMPVGGLRLIREEANRRIARQTRQRVFCDSFHSFSKLPSELRSTVLTHVVKDPGTIMLRQMNHHRKLQLHSKQCCGRCRAFDVHSDEDCRCKHSHVMSVASACECKTVDLVAPIFLMSKEIRREALWLFWSKNTFLAHGAMFHRFSTGIIGTLRSSLTEQVSRLPHEALLYMRRLIIDTDCPLAPLNAENDWALLFRRLDEGAALNPDLEIQVRISSLPVDVMGSWMWETKEISLFGGAGSPHKDRSDEQLAANRTAFIAGVRDLSLNVVVWERPSNGGAMQLLVAHTRQSALIRRAFSTSRYPLVK